MAACAAAVIAFSGASLGAAATVQPFGTRETLSDPGGLMVTAYTVSKLAPSSDVIPYRPMGKLYEATVTVEADRGTITPVLPPFMARTATGQNYPALVGVAAPLGVSPMSLMQGQRSTGKLYFDVTGQAPNSVAYNDGMADLMLWVGSGNTAPPPAAAPPAPAAPAPVAPPMTPPTSTSPVMPPEMPMMPTPPPPPPVPMLPGTPGY